MAGAMDYYELIWNWQLGTGAAPGSQVILSITNSFCKVNNKNQNRIERRTRHLDVNSRAVACHFDDSALAEEEKSCSVMQKDFPPDESGFEMTGVCLSFRRVPP